MVDSFSSAKPYSFEVDGKAYVLPGLAFGDIDKAAEALSGDAGQQSVSIRELLFGKSDARTQKAIQSLGVKDIGSLFRKWAGVEPGGLIELAGVIRRHRSELTADLRSTYGVSLWWAGTDALPMLELVDLVYELRRDPESRLNAALAGWKFPVSREWMAITDLFDLQHAKASKRRPKPLPRPWPDNKKKIGGERTVRRSIADVRSILRPKQ